MCLGSKPPKPADPPAPQPPPAEIKVATDEELKNSKSLLSKKTGKQKLQIPLGGAPSVDAGLGIPD